MKNGNKGSGERPVGWNATPRPAPVAVVSDIRPSDHGELDLTDVRSSLRSAMWKNVGIERTGAKLHDVGDMLNFWARYTLDKIFDDPAGWETQNMLLVGAIIARSAAWREETRGCHVRLDHPTTQDRFRLHDLWRRGGSENRTSPMRSPASTSTPAQPRTPAGSAP